MDELRIDGLAPSVHSLADSFVRFYGCSASPHGDWSPQRPRTVLCKFNAVAIAQEHCNRRDSWTDLLSSNARSQP